MAGQQLGSVGQLLERFYDQQAEQEWDRLGKHRTEFAVTLRALAEHMPPPARVLDRGSGPGCLGLELARQGYEVTLFDLSPVCLQTAREKATEAGLALAGVEQGTAVDLSRFGPATFDGVLLLGPLYHLLEEGERRQGLREAWRVLAPGGLLFAAFITRYTAIRYSAVYDPLWVLEDADRLAMLLETGVLPARRSGQPGFLAHYAHPTEAGPLVESEGFQMVSFWAWRVC